MADNDIVKIIESKIPINHKCPNCFTSEVKIIRLKLKKQNAKDVFTGIVLGEVDLKIGKSSGKLS